MTNKRFISSVSDIDAMIEEARVHSLKTSEAGRVELLCTFRLAGPIVDQMPRDPFSDDYRRAVVDFYEKVAQRRYDPATSEQIDFDISDRATRPGIYTFGDTRSLGSFVEAFGQILQAINLPIGTRVLEYGPGDGQIALMLARCGCDVSVVDVNRRYLDVIALQAYSQQTKVRCIQAEFLEEFDGGDFDAILFFETFHHAIDHQTLLARVREKLKPDGRIVFAGEPILDAANYWRDCVPYSWGLRLDGLSLCAIRAHGWMELGYQEEYFFNLLSRSGFTTDKSVSPNARGTCYIARKI